MWKILKEDVNMTYKEIQKTFEVSNHTTIVNGIKAISGYIEFDKVLKRKYILLRKFMLSNL